MRTAVLRRMVAILGNVTSDNAVWQQRREEWRRAVRYSDISTGAKVVLLALQDYQNRANGWAWPSNDRLAAELGVSDRTIKRHTSEGEKAGLLGLVWAGGRRFHERLNTRNNVWSFLIPGDVPSWVLSGEGDNPFSKGDNSCISGAEQHEQSNSDSSNDGEPLGTDKGDNLCISGAEQHERELKTVESGADSARVTIRVCKGDNPCKEGCQNCHPKPLSKPLYKNTLSKPNGSERMSDEKKIIDEEITPMAIPTDWVPNEQHAARMDELNFSDELMAGTVTAFYQRFDQPEILSTDWDKKFGWWINEVHRNPEIVAWTESMVA